jgi:phosphomannomutase
MILRGIEGAFAQGYGWRNSIVVMFARCDEIVRALADPGLVQSFSGVRARFGDGPGIPDELGALALAYGYVYAREVLGGRESAELVIGRDPRPTGAALTEMLARGFIVGASVAGCKVRLVNMGIITTPLIQSAVRALCAAGGVMITASHNPLTDNGFKFITGCPLPEASDEHAAPPGALLSAHSMRQVIETVQSLADDPTEFVGAVHGVDESVFKRVLAKGEDHERRIKAERAYLDAIGADWGIQPHCLKPLVLGPALLDPNGGAACGIGARVLEHFGVRAIEVNAELGYPEHGIDTDNLDPASGKHMLIRVARAALRNGAKFGIAFDYDADRGNLVLPGLDESAIIAPQTVAAANIALALAHRDMVKRDDHRKLAVVVSDATSGASVEVAGMFGAEVFTVETGEINVVTKMYRLRMQGYDVPIGVEGANGGTIFGTSTCRDGLQAAICAALGEEQPGLGKHWLNILRHNGHSHRSAAEVSLPSILEAVPSYFNKMLRLQGTPMPHAEVKSRMEQHFTNKLWPELSASFDSYEFRNYEGAQEVAKRSHDESGGWRLCLSAGGKQSFIFARGSRTESGIWRMIIDCPDAALGGKLIETARSLYAAASGK